MLKNQEDYEAALSAAEDIFDAACGTPEGEKLEQIISRIENYEVAHFPITAPQQNAAPRRAGDSNENTS